jgi:hypothetical protein
LPDTHKYHEEDAKEEDQMNNTTRCPSRSECLFPDVVKPLAFALWANESTRLDLIEEFGPGLGKFDNIDSYRNWLVQPAEGLLEYNNIAVVAKWFLTKRKKEQTQQRGGKK